MQIRPLLPFVAAASAIAPGVVLHLAGIPLSPAVAALVSGTAILGASFLLLWGCEAAQADISQALALAVVALIAVLPEYAVDMYFTWQAGKNPTGGYAQYAIANMTGANRLLIGVAWGTIAAIVWARSRKVVRLAADRRTELLFLGLATAYAFVIPVKGSLTVFDGLVFFGLYAWYIAVAAKRPCEEPEAIGPAAHILALATRPRRVITAVLFVVAAGAIVLNAESFCEGLIATGKQLGISEFLLVQWLAPIASEAPEFIVAIMFAWRGQASLALGSLLSAKLNQWTLLVGMIPAVFALSHGTLEHPIPMGSLQMSEILLTAAQSALAVVLLSTLRLSLSGALLLFGLFVGQLVLPGMAGSSAASTFGAPTNQVMFAALYLTAAVALFLSQPSHLKRLREGLRIGAPTGKRTLKARGHAGLRAGELDQCRTCEWKQAAQDGSR
jgi:cation:H+ antiporter